MAEHVRVLKSEEVVDERIQEIGEMADNVDVFVAGAKLADGQLVTSGGRVLGVTAIADTLQEAIDDAYEGVSKIRFEKSFCRHDIGQRALAAQK